MDTSANTVHTPVYKSTHKSIHKSIRCEFCHKKVPSTLEMQCSKCNRKLCIGHIQCEMHECVHDHRESGRVLLRKQLDVGKLADKLERL